jgi:DNA-binding PadR family transcriptional regulator
MRSVSPALLAKESAYGYEFKQAQEHTFGGARPSPDIGPIQVTPVGPAKDCLVRGEDVTQSVRPGERVHELTPAGREAVAEWLDAPGDGPRPRIGFFVKPALVPPTGTADRMTLINRQRRHCLNLMRGLSEPGHPEESDNPIASPLIEGAQLHPQADLEWLERCQEALT